MTIRIASGVTDQFLYFYAPSGLGSFSVARQRNGGTAVAMDTPTVTEDDAALAPGVYSLKLDEDMTIGAGNLTEAMVFYIYADGMTPQFVEVELFLPPGLKQMTESYAAVGVAPTQEQALFMIQQFLQEFAISGVTWSVKGLDGNTVKATFTLDDGSNPTSLTRAT